MISKKEKSCFIFSTAVPNCLDPNVEKVKKVASYNGYDGERDIGL